MWRKVVLMMVAHGLSVALLFLLSTSIYHRTQTFDMMEMGGLAQKAPVLSAFFVVVSGASVRELVREYEVQPEQDLIVIYDELDLPFGSMRVRPRGSSAGHNGIASVIGALQTQEVMRIR